VSILVIENKTKVRMTKTRIRITRMRTRMLSWLMGQRQEQEWDSFCRELVWGSISEDHSLDESTYGLLVLSGILVFWDHLLHYPIMQWLENFCSHKFNRPDVSRADCGFRMFLFVMWWEKYSLFVKFWPFHYR
jgi:hypothetical protein